jgi:hypothetical protein
MIPVANLVFNDRIDLISSNLIATSGTQSVSCPTDFVDYKNANGLPNSVGCSLGAETIFQVRHTENSNEVGCPQTDSIQIIRLLDNGKYYICAPTSCAATAKPHQCDKLVDGGVDVV